MESFTKLSLLSTYSFSFYFHSSSILRKHSTGNIVLSGKKTGEAFMLRLFKIYKDTVGFLLLASYFMLYIFSSRP